jgi:hypothetical protein
MAVELTTIEGVPLIRTGTYELSSGTRTFAEEDLRAAADAWSTDPAVKDPRVKIDSVAAALGLDDAAHGGEPAFGRFTNLRVSEDGQTLLADFVGPKSVAAAMTWAYPSLSIEGPPPGWVSATGRAHELVVSAVALLGVHWPGVTTLDDFHEFLTDGPKIEATKDAPEAVLARTAPMVRAGLDVDLVARRFVDGVDSGTIERPEGVEQAWSLWVTAIRLDDAGKPYLKVIDEQTGNLFRVDFTVKGSEVTFGEFVEVIEQDVPVAARAADAPRPAAPLARWGSREALRAAVQTIENEEASSMTEEQRRDLAAAHGLDPDTATEEQVIEAVVAAVHVEPDPEPVEPNPDPDPEPVVREPEPALTATVSRAQWEQQQREVAELRAKVAEREAREARERRDGLITAALTDGRLAPSERQTWREQLDAAPEATEHLLASLRPGAVPVHERGHDGSDAVAAGVEGTGWFDHGTEG